MININDFDYCLPKELIADKAAVPRSSSRMIVLDGSKIFHRRFYNIVDYLKKGDVLVVNETKVSKAKIFGRKETGAHAEIVIEEKVDGLRYRCRIKSSRPKAKDMFVVDNGIRFVVESKSEDGQYLVCFNKNPDSYIKKHGVLPIPYYIKKRVRDYQYQTRYAKKEGSLAAPTAGLHFTRQLLGKIERKGVKIAKVCLKIGFGTFREVNNKQIEEKRLHKEYYEISEEAADMINDAKRLFVTGTTSLRALESSNVNGKVCAGKGFTELFIFPGYRFKNKITGLITNFHLPRSSLLMLVSAFYGREKILRAYETAIQKKYRFYSLGDCMLLLK